MKRIFGLVVIALGLLLPVYVYAAPVVFFSDLTDGPVTGFNGSNTQGAAVSVWGTGFGATGSVTVGGQTLTWSGSADSNFAEWAATTNPTTARGLQRITFFLNSSMTTSGTAPNTTIKVTAGGVDSNTIPFHCRALGTNHIYFVSPTGSDAANGLTTSTPWQTGMKIKNTLVAGDVAYCRSGVYLLPDTSYTPHYAWITIYGYDPPDYGINSGSAYNSISVSSYPGEAAQIGDGYFHTNTDGDNGVENGINTRTEYGNNDAEIIWNYWTFSKIKWLCPSYSYQDIDSALPRTSDSNIRFVGNDFRTTYATYGAGGDCFSKSGGWNGSTYFTVLGNYFHSWGVPLPPTSVPTLATGTGTGLTGSYNAKYTYATLAGDNVTTYQESEMSPAAESPVALSNGALRVSWPSPSPNNLMAFNYVRIYRTLAGGSTYYYDQSVPLATGYVDSTTSDSTLLSANYTRIFGGNRSPAIYLEGFGTFNHVFIRYNEFTEGNGAALQNFAHTGWDSVDDLHFEYNYIHSSNTCSSQTRPSVVANGGQLCGSACSFWGSEPQTFPLTGTAYITNNIFENNLGGSISVTGGDLGGGGTFYVSNNTIYDPRNYFSGCYVMEMSGNSEGALYPFDVEFQNNIVWGSCLEGYSHSNEFNHSYVNIHGDHNLWYGGPYDPPTWSTTGDVNADPKFISATPASVSDLVLQSSSPALNTGTSLSSLFTTDYNLVTRPTNWSMGAIDNGSGSGGGGSAPTGGFMGGKFGGGKF